MQRLEGQDFRTAPWFCVFSLGLLYGHVLEYSGLMQKSFLFRTHSTNAKERCCLRAYSSSKELCQRYNLRFGLIIVLIQVNDQFSVPWVEANLSSAKRFFESVISAHWANMMSWPCDWEFLRWDLTKSTLTQLGSWNRICLKSWGYHINIWPSKCSWVKKFLFSYFKQYLPCVDLIVLNHIHIITL